MQITRPPWKRRPFLTNDLNYERPSRCKDILELYRYWLNIVNITPSVIIKQQEIIYMGLNKLKDNFLSRKSTVKLP
jgi:hypothetical protein